MNKKDLEHTVKNLHLSPEAKDRIARYLDSIPKGEEVFHAEPIQRSFFLHHAGIGIAACAMLAVGIGGIYAVHKAAPADGLPDSSASVLTEATAGTTNAADMDNSLYIPDFSDQPLTCTLIPEMITSVTDISGTGVESEIRTGSDAFSFALTADEQRALSAVISGCKWRKLPDEVVFKGADCLVLDFGNSVLEIWLFSDNEETFPVRYMPDQTNGAQFWYEADIQAYDAIMNIIGNYVGMDVPVVNCIPYDLTNADLRFSFVDDKENFYMVDYDQSQQLVDAFASAGWAYDAYRENSQFNAWITDTFPPEQSPAYYLYIHTDYGELYRCAVWLDTNGSDQIEFLHYVDGKLLGDRYTIEFDETLKQALTACMEPCLYGYAPEKPDAFRAVTIWDDQLLPVEELDLSQYEKLLTDFNEEHGTDITFSSILETEGYDYEETFLRTIAVMTPDDFIALLNAQIGYRVEAEEQISIGEDGEIMFLKPLGNAIRAADTLAIMNADLKPEDQTFTYHYSLSNEDAAQTVIMEKLAYVMTDLKAYTTDDNPNPKKECLHIDTGSHNIRFYSLDATSVTTSLYVTFKGTDTDWQSYYVDIEEYNQLTDVLSDLKQQKDAEWQAYIDEFERQPAPPFADLIRETLSVEASYYSLEESDGVTSYFLTDAQIEEIAELFEKTTFTRHFDWGDNIGTDHAAIGLHDQKDDFSFALYTYQENGDIVDLRIHYSGIADHDGTRTGAVCITVDDLSMAEKLIAVIKEGA